MRSIREVLRRLLLGKRHEKYWRELRSYQRDPRSRYHRPQHEGRGNDKQITKNSFIEATR